MDDSLCMYAWRYTWKSVSRSGMRGESVLERVGAAVTGMRVGASTAAVGSACFSAARGLSVSAFSALSFFSARRLIGLKPESVVGGEA